jgi:hypothetical protein
MIRSRESITAGVTAILAAVALLVQVMLPSVAMARAARDGGALIQVCSGAGSKTLSVDSLPSPDDGHAPAQGFGGLHCIDCVMASVAGIAPPSPPVPVRLGAAVRFKPPLVRVLAHGPRSPPRVREQSPRAPPEL